MFVEQYTIPSTQPTPLQESVEWTDQSAFEYAARKVIAQGRQSKNGLACKYRHPDGLKCHVGHLIPDDQYNPIMEDKMVSAFELRISALKNLNKNILIECQLRHDEEVPVNSFIKHYKAGLRNIAFKYNLDASFLNTM